MPARPRRISEMRNLGSVSERQLKEVDITTPGDLEKLGAVEAWLRLKFVFGKQINRNFLYAIEGALRDCDWRSLPPEIKSDLIRQTKSEN